MAKKPKTDNKTVKDLDGRFIILPLNFYVRGRYLSKDAKWLYVTLKSFENNKTKLIFPKQETIQEVGNLGKNAITKALKELESFGWIKRIKTKGQSTTYQLLEPTNPMGDFEETIVQIPSREAAIKWRNTQRILKSKNGKTFAEKFEEKEQVVTDYEKQKVSQSSKFENDYDDFEIDF